MNLIYMHTHDTGRCYQPYGYPVATPHIQQLAEQSLQFNCAFSCAPTCSPSRAALLTGLAPHSCGMLGLAHRGFGLYDKNQHLAAWLGQHGFETVLCGTQHEAASARELPYERILPHNPAIREKRESDAFDRYNCGQVEDFLHQEHHRPFFLSYGLRSTHRPYPPHQDNPDRLAPLPGIPNTAETRADTADFHEAIHTVDSCVGRVLQTLKETGHDRDTMVLFTTDHGPAFPNVKCTLHDGGIGVTLMLAFPGNARAGQVCDQLVSQLDLFPTICDLLQIEKPAWLQGISLLPLFSRESPVRQAITAEITYHAAYEPVRCIRTTRYKLIRRYDWHNRIVPANIDASPSKALMVSAGLLEQCTAREELYDLLLDPAEAHNRINDPALRDIYGELSSQLFQWMRDTNDPLLTEAPRVAKPLGARVNSLSASEPDAGDWES